MEPNASANGSQEFNPPSQPPLDYTIVAQLLPLALVIVTVNSLVVALFWKKHQLRTPPNYFLLGLALSDLITGLVNIPLFLILMMRVIRPPADYQPLAFLVPVCHNFSAVLAAFQILAITTEKFIAIRNPLKRRLLGTKTTRRVLAGIWLVSAVIAFFPFCFYSKRNEEVWLTVRLAHAIFCIVVVFLVPYAFMIYAQFVMFKTISRSGQLVMGGQDKNQSRTRRKLKHERKSLVVFASMAAIYAICWLPWFCFTLFITLLPFGAVHEVDPVSFEKSAQAFVIIRYFSSIINPLLYTFFKRDFLNAFKVVVLKKPAPRGFGGTISLSLKTMRA